MNEAKSIKLTDLKPDPSNANRGTERGLRALDDSLAQVGLGRSIVVDKDMNVVAGNKTLERALDRGFEDAVVVHTKGDKLVVVVRDDMDLMDADPNNPARRYAYYDNRVSQLDLDFDPAQLFADQQAGFDFDGLFTEMELGELFAGLDRSIEGEDNNYSRKIEAPIYEPSPQKPSIDDLFDTSKTEAMVKDIQRDTSLTDEEQRFLIAAAQRFTVLNFTKIADYYAHSPANVQHLMEDSALVIIDFDRAIELGFVKLTERIAALYEDDYGA